jgi:bacterioferritin
MKTKNTTPGNGSRDPALRSLEELRRTARQHIEEGAVTPGYDADRETVLKLLNTALATELVCVLRYRRHYFVASGILAETIKKEFLQHAQEEQGHADQIAERIVQLGGSPDFNPASLSERSHAEYAESEELEQMIVDDLVAERVAIESYRDMIHYMEGRDSTTRRMLEGILAVEEQHAEELSSMLDDVHDPFGANRSRSARGATPTSDNTAARSKT